MRTPDIYLAGLGTYLPDVVPTPNPVDDDSMTGAMVAGGLPAVEMALSATRDALAEWGGNTDQLSLLLYADTFHAGPDGWAPHSYLQRHAAGGHVLAAGVRQGCNGLFGALELGSAYLAAQRRPTAAVIALADNYDAPGFDRWNTLTGYCMSDGASAVVLSTEGGFARLLSVTSTTIPELEELHRGDEPLHPASVVVGRPLSFQARGDAFIGRGGMTHDLAVTMFKVTVEVVSRALDEAGIDRGRITRAVMGNEPRPRIADRLNALGLPPDISTWEYSRTIGHCGSDQLFALDHLIRAGALAPGDHLLLYGVGPGLNLAAAVVEVLGLPAGGDRAV